VCMCVHSSRYRLKSIKTTCLKKKKSKFSSIVWNYQGQLGYSMSFNRKHRLKPPISLAAPRKQQSCCNTNFKMEPNGAVT
jgi:hypothetical protein